MSEEKRELLTKLKFELDFIEDGGYGRSVRTPHKPTSVFQDSLTCLNFGDPSHGLSHAVNAFSCSMFPSLARANISRATTFRWIRVAEQSLPWMQATAKRFS